MAWPFIEETIRARGVLVRRAGIADARRVAAYHTDNAEHLRRWDVGWSEAHTSEKAQALRLQPDEIRWTGWLQRTAGLRSHLDLQEDRRVDGLIELERQNATGSPVSGKVTLVISYSCSPAHEGLGMMTNALTAVLGELARGLPTGHTASIEVFAHVREDNIRSSRLLQRMGFSDHGIDREFPAIPFDGTWKRHHRWGLSLPLNGA